MYVIGTNVPPVEQQLGPPEMPLYVTVNVSPPAVQAVEITDDGFGVTVKILPILAAMQSFCGIMLHVQVDGLKLMLTKSAAAVGMLG